MARIRNRKHFRSRELTKGTVSSEWRTGPPSVERAGCRQGTKLIKFSWGGGIHLGTIHKLLTQNFANIWPPPPPLYKMRTQWSWPPIPLYARTQFDLVYTKYDKYNIESVIFSPKLSFYASMSIFKYNAKLIRCKYLEKSVRTQHPDPPPPVRSAYASAETPPSSVRTEGLP